MSNTTEFQGFTEVWEGYASEGFAIYKNWIELGEDNVKFQDEEVGVSIWVANEFINWSHFRDTGEYVSSTQKVKRAGGKRGQKSGGDTPASVSEEKDLNMQNVVVGLLG